MRGLVRVLRGRMRVLRGRVRVWLRGRFVDFQWFADFGGYQEWLRVLRGAVDGLPVDGRVRY